MNEKESAQPTLTMDSKEGSMNDLDKLKRENWFFQGLSARLKKLLKRNETMNALPHGMQELFGQAERANWFSQGLLSPLKKLLRMNVLSHDVQERFGKLKKGKFVLTRPVNMVKEAVEVEKNVLSGDMQEWFGQAEKRNLVLTGHVSRVEEAVGLKMLLKMKEAKNVFSHAVQDRWDKLERGKLVFRQPVNMVEEAVEDEGGKGCVLTWRVQAQMR